MKKIIALTLASLMILVSLAGCVAEKNDGFVFTEENYPKMGGSLANLPLGEAVTATVLGIDREKANSMIVFEGSTTDNYEWLVDGTFDIILAYKVHCNL